MKHTRDLRTRLVVALATILISIGLGLTTASPASAAPVARTAVTTQRMSAAALTAQQAGWYQGGTTLQLSCYAHGQAVQGYFSSYFPGGWDRLWYRVSDGFWVADIDIETGTNDPVTRPCPTRTFNPQAAVQSAIANADAADWTNPDCTFFTSRTLWDAGLPQTPTWRTGDSSNFNLYGASFNAINADGFKNYVVNNGLATITPRPLSWSDPSAGGAQLGDVIGYDWNNDAIHDHLGIVIGFQPGTGRPLLAEHGTTPRIRYWDIGSTGQTYPQMDSSYRAWLIHEIA